MNLLSIVLPWWAKWAAIAALVAAASAATWQRAATHYEREAELQRLRVQRAGAAQNARTALQIEQQKRITEGVVHGWDQAVRDLRERYAAPPPRPAAMPGARRAELVRLREQPAAGSGLLPAFPRAAGPADGAPADCRLADSAETTLMLVTLQEWVRAQAAVMPDP